MTYFIIRFTNTLRSIFKSFRRMEQVNIYHLEGQNEKKFIHTHRKQQKMNQDLFQGQIRLRCLKHDLHSAMSSWPQLSNAILDFSQVYSFIGNVFHPNTCNHLQKLKEMNPIEVDT
ncbi:hypothetical protein C5167_026700, partial [Papaver somniferum]